MLIANIVHKYALYALNLEKCANVCFGAFLKLVQAFLLAAKLATERQASPA